MPTIRNLTRQLLHLHRIGRVIEPEQSLDVTDAEAQLLAGHPQLAGVPPYPQPDPEPDAEPAASVVVVTKPSKSATKKDGESQ
jgi:hypothetical protein